MPVGKVKWFDPAKGFGFLSQSEGPDVYVHADALPEGTENLKAGTRVEFGIAQGRRGDQALQVRVLDPTPSVERGQRNQRSAARSAARTAAKKKPDEMIPIVEDLIRVLDGLGEGYRRGHTPDAKTAAPIANLLRALADELD